MYMGDPDFTQVPTKELLDKDYIASRAKLITDTDQPAVAGDPVDYLSYAADDSYELPSTSHVSIVDSKGNCISSRIKISCSTI